MNTCGPLILVVEDDASTQKLIARTLVKGGCRVLETATGEAAMELIQTRRPQALVLDIMLPGINGFDVCRTLRASGEEIGILMLTAKGEDDDKIHGLELGADDYMVKPFNPPELLARLGAILRRTTRSLQPDDHLEYRGLRIEFRQQKCFKDDQPVDLTPREFLLLAELMKSPRNALSREELTTRLWGQDHHGSPKSLDVYIRRLRKKIEDEPSDPQRIRTAWGFGYVFE